MRILILEDNDDLAVRLVEQITGGGFAVDRVATLSDAGIKIAVVSYVLAILDRRLPDGDGIQLVQSIRAHQPQTRILMLTALDDDAAKVAGLEAGADDYLVKPYNPAELMARIRANIRRLDGQITPPTTVANLSFAFENKQVQVDGRTVPLQRRELELLEALMRRPGRVVARDRILDELYGDHEELHWNHLNRAVSHLRKTLSDAGAHVKIHALRGIGYFISGCI